MKVAVLAVGFPIPLPLPATVKIVGKDFWRKGDVNKDGVIDETDGDLLRAAYGATPASPNWNPDCDLNEDGTIDHTDLSILLINYGAKAPVENIPTSIEVAEDRYTLIGCFMEQEYSLEISKDATVGFIFDPLTIATTAIILGG